MDTKEYRTRTFFRENPTITAHPDKWVIGLDIGYSGVKGYGQNAIECFPSFAVESTDSPQVNLGVDSNMASSIQYKDEDGIWDVGAGAQDSISASDTNAGSLATFGRHRYFNPMFKVLLRTGIAGCLRKNQYGDPKGKKIVLQTGLPPRYDYDKEDMMEVMRGHHHFCVKYGLGDWEEFDFYLDEENINPIIAQPLGTIMSIATTKDWKMSPDVVKYMSSRVLVMDAGFGTLDFFPMIKGRCPKELCETDHTLGMKRVLQDTANEIAEKYHFEVSVPAMQQYLETGYVPAKVGRTYQNVPFGEILERHSKNICNKAMDKLLSTYQLYEYPYLVVTGGTCAAWSNYIRDHEAIKCGNTTKIIAGNQGDMSLPYIMSNVRGYFTYALSNLK